jgi:hypothetical protein
VSVAIRVDPETLKVPDPSAVVPEVKVTVPPGAALPLAGTMLAVTTVFPVGLMLVGAADTVVVVATAPAGEVRVTATVVAELEKPAAPL